jgi:hypothetical protein
MDTVPNAFGDYTIAAEVLNDPCRLMRLGDSIDLSAQYHEMRTLRPSLWGGWLENGLALSSSISANMTRTNGGGGQANGAGYANHLIGQDVCARWNSPEAVGVAGEWYLNRVVDAPVPGLYDAAQSFGRLLWINNPDVAYNFETIWVTSPQSPNGKVQLAAGSNYSYTSWHADSGPVNLFSASVGFVKYTSALNKTGIDGTRVLNFPIRIVNNKTMSTGDVVMLANFGFVRADGLGLVYANANIGGYTTLAYGDSANFSDAAWQGHLTAFGATHVWISLSANNPGSTTAIVRDRVQVLINKIRAVDPTIGIIISTKYETNSNHDAQRDTVRPAYLELVANNARTLYLDIWNESGADEFNLHDTFVVNESGVYTHPTEAGRWAFGWWANILMQRAADAAAAAAATFTAADRDTLNQAGSDAGNAVSAISNLSNNLDNNVAAKLGDPVAGTLTGDLATVIAKTNLLNTSVTNTGNIGTTNIAAVANKLAAMINGSNQYSSSAMANAPSTLVITPIVASVTNPRHATRDLAAILQGAENTDYWDIVDATGAAIDLSAKTVRFVVCQVDDEGDVDDRTDDELTPLYQYTTGDDDNITISGDDDNRVSITHVAENTGTPGVFRYFLINVTDNIPLATGKLPIKPAKFSV